jgi:hypothetical protein
MRKAMSASEIESKEGFRLRPSVDLRDVCHQRPHTTENDASRPRFLPSFSDLIGISAFTSEREAL